jgi:TPR repeat protein
LGTTYDPVVLQRLGAIGTAADPIEARQWYQRAAALGSTAASQQLAVLGDPR